MYVLKLTAGAKCRHIDRHEERQFVKLLMTIQKSTVCQIVSTQQDNSRKRVKNENDLKSK